MLPRHEQVKYALAHALRSVDGSLATVEPHIQGTMRRNDIRFVPPPDVPLPRFDVDIKVVSLSALDALHHPTPPHPPTDPIERRQFTIDDYLKTRAKRVVDHLRDNEASTIDYFRPLVLLVYWRRMPWDFSGAGERHMKKSVYSRFENHDSPDASQNQGFGRVIFSGNYFPFLQSSDLPDTYHSRHRTFRRRIPLAYPAGWQA